MVQRDSNLTTEQKIIKATNVSTARRESQSPGSGLQLDLKQKCVLVQSN